MFRLRQEQCDALMLDARERYVRTFLATLPEVFPGDPAVLDELAMRRLIESAIERAAAYGIRDDPDVTLFAYLLHELGDSFDGTPWISAVLTDGSLLAGEKMQAIYKRLEQRS